MGHHCIPRESKIRCSIKHPQSYPSKSLLLSFRFPDFPRYSPGIPWKTCRLWTFKCLRALRLQQLGLQPATSALPLQGIRASRYATLKVPWLLPLAYLLTVLSLSLFLSRVSIQLSSTQSTPMMCRHYMVSRYQQNWAFVAYSKVLSNTAFFFLRFFLTWTIFLKSLLNFLQYYFCFMFWFFGHEACGTFAPRPGIEPAPPALEGEVLTTGLPAKSQHSLILIFPVSFSLLNHSYFLEILLPK